VKAKKVRTWEGGNRTNNVDLRAENGARWSISTTR